MDGDTYPKYLGTAIISILKDIFNTFSFFNAFSHNV